MTSFAGMEALIASVSVQSMADVRQAALSLRDFALSFGMRAALCDDIASSEPMVDADGQILAADPFGWLQDAERWWEDRVLALRSPLPRACRYESQPFWCNASGFHTLMPNPYLEDIDISSYFEQQKRYQASIVIPVHLPFSQISANSYVPMDPDVDDMSALFAEVGTMLGILTRRFIASYVQAIRTQRRIPADCELSKREVECLRWAAVGKTDHEIGAIISLSHATVRYHLRRAGEKLETVNRAQTIFKAGQLGYLGASS